MTRYLSKSDFDLRDPEGAAAATRRWVAETPTGTLFEAVVIAGDLMARVDILHKEGDRIDLIEVKSTSINSDENPGFRGKRGEIASDKREYVEDVAFQTQVLREAYPEYRVTPFL